MINCSFLNLIQPLNSSSKKETIVLNCIISFGCTGSLLLCKGLSLVAGSGAAAVLVHGLLIEVASVVVGRA